MYVHSRSEKSWFSFTINTKHSFLYANLEKNCKKSSSEQVFLKREEKLDFSVATWSVSFPQKKELSFVYPREKKTLTKLY